jgi:hypothetical protein
LDLGFSGRRGAPGQLLVGRAALPLELSGDASLVLLDDAVVIGQPQVPGEHGAAACDGDQYCEDDRARNAAEKGESSGHGRGSLR